MYLAILSFSFCNVTSAMNMEYELPSKGAIKDRLRCKLRKHFGNQFGNNIGDRFVKTTKIHETLAKKSLTPCSVVIQAENNVGKFYSLHMSHMYEENATNTPQPQLKQIVIRELLKEHPRAIEALTNNYGFLPPKIK